MSTPVRVYVKSISISCDIGDISYSQHHAYCAPGMAERSLETLGLRGRILESDSAELLPILDDGRERWGRQIQVCDVGRLPGRLKALMAGVRITPTVVVNGERHVGLAAAKQVLSGLVTATTRESASYR